MLPNSGRHGRQPDTLPLREAREQFERQVILRVMERVHWNRTEAARILGLHRNGLKLKLEALGIRRGD
jgi:DNA-binding NtrC family response regulator